MNTSRLKHIEIENFRSIKGEISISLDSPIILIHGPNGTGKTSILSAIELGLTGKVGSLERFDPDYVPHLIHKSAEGAGKVTLSALVDDVPFKSNVVITAASIKSDNKLNDFRSRFFNDRCFLAQSALGRLLEIYQHQDSKKKADSPLTNFVKDLLGLSQLDALIDGLRASGDVRRLKDGALKYWDAKESLQRIDDELSKLNEDIRALEVSTAKVVEPINILLTELGIAGVDLKDPNTTQAALRDQSKEADLAKLTFARRQLAAVREQLTRNTALKGSDFVASIESEDRTAQEALSEWNKTDGEKLTKVVAECASIFPSLPSGSTLTPGELRETSANFVDQELARIFFALTNQENNEAALEQLRRAIEVAQTRLTNLDRQIENLAQSSTGLAEALSAIAPHIHGEDCPVCSRNFTEVGRGSLQSLVSSKITAIYENAGRLQALSADRSATTKTLTENRQQLEALASALLQPHLVSEYKIRQARLLELHTALADLEGPASVGTVLERRARETSKALADYRNSDTLGASIRTSVDEVAYTVGQPILSESEATQDGIARLEGYISTREFELQKWEEQRLNALALIHEIRDSISRLSYRQRQFEITDNNRKSIYNLKEAADQSIELAKDIVKRTKLAKSRIVNDVFSKELNAIWRDLFIRLAPDESFVPAFAIPPAGSELVEAKLETYYREGGKGGDPRSMLSAGNLNTAALTLFLALHLSVQPTLPWLIIDDPVQSMDEVHISQFAALLRTLSKQHARQVVIAVHEKALFDYLSLELSPAFFEDRLVTVELQRGIDGRSLALCTTHIYREDKLFAA